MWSELATASGQSSRGIRFLPAERYMLWGNALVGGLAALLALAKQQPVSWQPFILGYASTLALSVLGAYVRQAKSAPRLGMALMAIGIYAGFIAVSLVFIFALMPLSRPLIDPSLMAMDSFFGYDWPTFVAWLAKHPMLGQALGEVYLSSQKQLLATILILSFLSRDLALLRFLAVGMISLCLAVMIWCVIPSLGPSAFLEVSESDARAIGLHYTPAFGATLRDLIQNGPAIITPEIYTGVIAFPSYHFIMAALVVWFLRGTPAFVPALLLNLAMIVATLSHGAHHVMDLFGGLAVFSVSVWIANNLIRPAQPA